MTGKAIVPIVHISWIIFLVFNYVLGLGIYLGFKTYRRRKGIEIDKVCKEILVEEGRTILSNAEEETRRLVDAAQSRGIFVCLPGRLTLKIDCLEAGLLQVLIKPAQNMV